MATTSTPMPGVILFDRVNSGADKIASWADRGQDLLGAVRAVAGANAFRSYSLIANTAALNASGNLRGMVLSARWRTIYQITDTSSKTLREVGDLAADVALLATVAAGLVAQSGYIEQVLRSNDSASVKALILATVAGTIAERALLGVVSSGVHGIYWLLEQELGLTGRLGGPMAGFSSAGIQTLRSADTLVQTTITQIPDTQTLGAEIWNVIEIGLSKVQ